nr:co-chaperone GroES [uncultured Tessaracoccus sp.]
MSDAQLAIRMLHDRVLVDAESGDHERTSGGGILIPATVQMGKRLAWAKVVSAGPSVRAVEVGDRVLFDPEDRAEVELNARRYVLLRERDIHAVAAERLDDAGTGLYL